MRIISRRTLREFWTKHKVIIREVKPIKTEADYSTALRNIEQLWGASYGSPEGDKLDILVTLVDAYENEHYPMQPPDPIEAILHYMESQRLTEHDLEPYIGSRSCVRNLE